MFARLRALVRALTARRGFEARLTEELRFHIEQSAEDLVRSGVLSEEARRRARMELGGVNTVKEECREARGLGGFDALERESRYAARQFWRNPGFAGTVVLTLALAIGANTAMFSLVNALLLKDLPYTKPERIGTLYAFSPPHRGSMRILWHWHNPSVRSATSASSRFSMPAATDEGSLSNRITPPVRLQLHNARRRITDSSPGSFFCREQHVAPVD